MPRPVRRGRFWCLSAASSPSNASRYSCGPMPARANGCRCRATRHLRRLARRMGRRASPYRRHARAHQRRVLHRVARPRPALLRPSPLYCKCRHETTVGIGETCCTVLQRPQGVHTANLSGAAVFGSRRFRGLPEGAGDGSDIRHLAHRSQRQTILHATDSETGNVGGWFLASTCSSPLVSVSTRAVRYCLASAC